MKRVALACKNPTKWFHDCEGCEHYDGCDYFAKFERKTNQYQQLKTGLAERTKVRHRREKERRKHYFK